MWRQSSCRKRGIEKNERTTHDRSEQDYRDGSATVSGRATARATRSCKRPCHRLSAVCGRFDAAIAAYGYFAEGIVEPLPVEPLLLHRFFGLTLAGHLVIGDAGNRGEIIEIRPHA